MSIQNIYVRLQQMLLVRFLGNIEPLHRTPTSTYIYYSTYLVQQYQGVIIFVRCYVLLLY